MTLFKNFAAICFSDNIPTWKDTSNIIFLGILSQKQTAVEFFAYCTDGIIFSK